MAINKDVTLLELHITGVSDFNNNIAYYSYYNANQNIITTILEVYNNFCELA